MVAEALVLDELFQKAHAEKDHQWAEMGHQKKKKIPVLKGYEEEEKNLQGNRRRKRGT